MEQLIELDSLKASITDKILKHNLDSIALATEQLWGPDTRIIEDFTDHGATHSDRIAGYINKLLKCNKSNPLSESERFLLIAGIYLHDIGMQCDIANYPCILREAISFGAHKLGNFAAKSASDYSDIETEAIRTNHHLITAAWISCAKIDSLMPDSVINRAIKFIESVYIEDLIDICMYHSTLNILNCPCDFNCQTTGKERKRLVAALLRFGDELDIDHRRTSGEELKLFRKPPKSEAHWELHRHTRIQINSDDGRVTLLVALNPEDTKLYGTIIKERYIDRFPKKNQSLFDLLVRV